MSSARDVQTHSNILLLPSRIETTLVGSRGWENLNKRGEITGSMTACIGIRHGRETSLSSGELNRDSSTWRLNLVAERTPAYNFDLKPHTARQEPQAPRDPPLPFGPSLEFATRANVELGTIRSDSHTLGGSPLLTIESSFA